MSRMSSQKDGYIIPNKASLQKIELIAEQIRTTLLEGDYVKALTEYTKTFEAHGQLEFGALIDDLGCSPFDNEAYPPLSISRLLLQYSEFGSLW